MQFTSYNTGFRKVDPMNNPKKVVIKSAASGTSVELPSDVIILIDGEKIIAETQILDGFTVFERISQKNYEIQFQFTIREFSKFFQLVNGLPASGYIFPQSIINDIFGQVFEPNKSLEVENTLLNGIGITKLVFGSIALDTIRGNTNVPIILKCKQEYEYTSAEGQSLIVK